uniref:Uncharacterized protein n=1 Tax=Anguilla anguilla TaxID=7936 RepID=A0A0E9QBX4_ANGAN
MPELNTLAENGFTTGSCIPEPGAHALSHWFSNKLVFVPNQLTNSRILSSC